MPLLLTDQNLNLHQSFPLNRDQIKHFVKSLRMKEGDFIKVGSTEGDLFRAEMRLENNDWEIYPVEKLVSPLRPNPITLYISLIKKDKLEFVIQKAVELNIERIVPIISERSSIKEISPNYKTRLQKIIWGACEQSERLKPLILEDVLKLNEVKLENKTHLVCLERIEKSCQRPKASNKNYGLWIGPEGGWSESEKKYFEKYKFSFLHLGPLIQRAETASISGINYINYNLLD